jgi:hypothetical protein
MAIMAEAKKLTPLEYLRQFSPEATTAFQALRDAVIKSGPLDHNTCEIEGGFKTHARRLLTAGVSADALRQAVLVTLGATTTFTVALDALRWIDELQEGR